MAKSRYLSRNHYGFDLAVFLIREQFRAEVEKFAADYPLASSDESLREDLERLEHIILPELAAMRDSEEQWGGCMAENIGSMLIRILAKREPLDILSGEMFWGAIRKILGNYAKEELFERNL